MFELDRNPIDQTFTIIRSFIFLSNTLAQIHFSSFYRDSS